MQGWRINMEDAHTHLLALPGDPLAAFFGVFDGHGGSAIAQYTSQHLHKKIVQQSHYSKCIFVFSFIFWGKIQDLNIALNCLPLI